MDQQRPVFSQKNQCQDCYKCVRQCPVKAIRIEEASAQVVPEACIACGRCVAACRFEAKRVRDDRARAKRAVQTGRAVLALAPSWVSQYDGISPGQLAAAARRLGFMAVSEVALGAEAVSGEIAELLAEALPGVYLSTACPVAVAYVFREHPEVARHLLPVLSPMLAHARLIKEARGADVEVVFVGPCIGKKLEVDRAADGPVAALTFSELDGWLLDEGVSLKALPSDGPRFLSVGARPVPEGHSAAALYPLVGGQCATLADDPRLADVAWLTVAGLSPIESLLSGLAALPTSRRVFVELLACEGGCVGGPAARVDNPVAHQLRLEAKPRTAPARVPAAAARGLPFTLPPARRPPYAAAAIDQALWRVGKDRPEDELDCAGCGYPTCRAFAAALLAGMAEEAMCVSYMRRLAQKKANALLSSAPFGIVLAADDLKILDCNARFAALLGDDERQIFESVPGLAGLSLNRVPPLAALMAPVLKSGEGSVQASLILGERRFQVTLFTIEPRRCVGALLHDVTEGELRREEIAKKAKRVIESTLSTVQDIAFRLGRSAAESEVILNSIIHEFGPEKGRP